LCAAFNCPRCNALYHVVKVEAGPETIFADVSCRLCGEPLAGREDQFVLKYFLLRKTSRARKLCAPDAPYTAVSGVSTVPK
jgi:hypothetical protein